ncbi:MAG: Lon protease family protein [Gammaproteobacteria bacterium]
MQRLDRQHLYTPCDPQRLPDYGEAAQTPADVPDPLDASIGQDRALEAVDFGIAVEQPGFNIFALGPPGLGKSTTILAAVRGAAKAAGQPSDWCYVHNFVEPHRPRALELPSGRGRRFADDLRELIEELENAAPAIFDNEDTHARLQEIEEEFQERRTHALDELKKEGEAMEIAVIETPTGFTFAPTGRGRTIITPDVFERLTETEKEEIHKSIAGLKDNLQKLVRQFQVWRKEARDKVKALYQELAELAVGAQVTTLLDAYADLPRVREHLEAMRTDLVDNIDDFLPHEESPMAALGRAIKPVERYKVNVLVSHDEPNSAPVVCEDTPNHGNLVGRIEHRAHMGTLITDFSLIKPGALHRANGGFLVLDARRVLMQPFAWETLKSTLRAAEIKIESLERAFSMTSPVTLEPEPIPLDVKVVLIGDRRLYYMLGLYDPELGELFKVAADFDSIMDRNEAAEIDYAKQIVQLGRTHHVKPLDRGAMARVVEHGSRLAGDARKLSTHLGDLSDLLVEADHHAGHAGRECVTREDVQRAVDTQIRRADRIRSHIQDAIAERILLIDTQGEAVAQVNGLSVMQLGNHSFGHPTRITATARVGKGEVVDIERQIELGGPIHSKGVLILSNYLMSRYGGLRPISVTASLVFEQSYGGVEGDSASLAELCALLSALSGLPIKQSLAMTGSVNQLGRAQAIGGVNEKIEGYFDVCQRRGLNGEHGVIIPSANVTNLMLREDVLEACASERFSIHSVEDIDEAISLMTGVPAGEPDAGMRFAPDTVNGKVQARVDELAESRRAFAEPLRSTASAAVNDA